MSMEERIKPELRKEKVAQLLINNTSIQDTAKIIGISKSTVTRDLKKLKPQLEKTIETEFERNVKFMSKESVSTMRMLKRWKKLPDEPEFFGMKFKAIQEIHKQIMDRLDALGKLRTKVTSEEREDVWAEMYEHIQKRKRELADLRRQDKEGIIQ